MLSSKEISASKFSALLARHVFFFLLHQMEEGKGEDEGGGNGGRTLVMQKSSWSITLVVMMNLLRHIMCRDRVPSSGVAGGSPILIRSGTCLGQLLVASAVPQPSSHAL